MIGRAEFEGVSERVCLRSNWTSLSSSPLQLQSLTLRPPPPGALTIPPSLRLKPPSMAPPPLSRPHAPLFPPLRPRPQPSTTATESPTTPSRHLSVPPPSRSQMGKVSLGVITGSSMCHLRNSHLHLCVTVTLSQLMSKVMRCKHRQWREHGGYDEVWNIDKKNPAFASVTWHIWHL